MQKSPVMFVRDEAEMLQRLFSLKQTRCPHCGFAGTLNRHSRSHGNNPCAAWGRVIRGQRVFCSNRGRRGGCGRTFSLFFAWVLPRHTCTATQLWAALTRVHAGETIQSAWKILQLPLALDTLYHLLQRLRRRLEAVRSSLCRLRSPPCCHADPLLQTVAHLQQAFTASECAVSAFHLHFQCPLMG